MVRLQGLRRAVAAVVAAACAFASVTFTQVAATAYDTNTGTAASAINYTSKEKEVIEVFKTALKNFASEIDVTKYANDGMTAEKLTSLYIDTVYDDPDLFYVAKFNHYKTEKYEGFSYYNYFKFDNVAYTINQSEYSAYKARLDTAVAKARTYMSAASSQAELALLAHDYIIANCKYDLPAASINPNTASDKKAAAKQAAQYATVYSALVQGSAICEGYAAAFKYLMNSFGVQCEIVSSAVMNHAWDIVKIDGNWYHVDVTFDDPMLNRHDQFGRVSHDNLLLSDTAISTTKDASGASSTGVHRDWDARNLQGLATSKTYDNAFWKGSNSAIVKANGYLYFAKVDPASPAFNPAAYSAAPNYNENFYNFYTNLYRYDWTTNAPTKVATITSTWFAFGTENAASKSWTSGSFLSLASYGKYVLYNTAKGLGAYNTATGSTSIIKDLSWYSGTTNLAPPPAQYQGYFYGLVVKDVNEQKVWLTLKKAANDADAVYYVSLPKAP